MSVVFRISGREAIPVRAIPLIAPVPYGVSYLVEGLMCCDRDNAMHGLTAYQWSPGANQPLEVPPAQWRRVHIRLLGLAACLKREESAGRVSPDEGLDRLSRESIHMLPAGVFVWKDEFVDARTRKLRRVPEDEIVALENSSRDHIKFLQQQLELPANDPDVALWEYPLGENWREQLAASIAEERAIDPIPPESIVLYERICCGQAPLTDVSFSPLVETDLRKQVMEGFEHLLPAEIPAQTSTMHGRDSQRPVSSTPAADLPQSVINAMTVGYRDLQTLCNVHDEDDFGGFVVKKTGLYVKNHKKYNKHAWSLLTPSEKAVLAWHPTGEYDKPALQLPCTLGQLRSFVGEAGLAGCLDEDAVGQLLTSVVKNDEATLLSSARENAAPERFSQRYFEDGFDKVTGEKAGEQNFEARVAAVNLTDERCIQLANSHELRIADWTALTGIGIGVHWSHLVTTEGVAFRNWTEREIREASVNQQIAMHRDNEAVPLEFPCTPARLIQFIDAAPPGSHSFSLPDVFRQVMTESEQTTDTLPLVSAESQGQTATEVTPTGISKREVLAVDWPLHGQFNQESLSAALSDVREWLKPARTALGSPGKASALWNPAKLADCLVSKRYANQKAIGLFLGRHFAEWLPEWEKLQGLATRTT